jgi:hypothetical protein
MAPDATWNVFPTAIATGCPVRVPYSQRTGVLARSHSSIPTIYKGDVELFVADTLIAQVTAHDEARPRLGLLPRTAGMQHVSRQSAGSAAAPADLGGTLRGSSGTFLRSNSAISVS